MTGILLVDKPAGPSSAQVAAVVKHLTGSPRVGHGGTLDPFATGLLPVLVGREFTREADRLLAGDKAYRVTVRLGSETDTCDLTGRVVGVGSRPLPSRDAIAAVLPAFTGEVMQEPPVFSALKVAGKPMYWYARKGRAVTPEARPVRIDAIDLVEWIEPDLVLDVRCGKGAYMRSLGRDVGRALGCLGHLVALRRTAVGPFSVADAVPLHRIESGGRAAMPGWLRSA
ncbi:MAG: tRNA pseudouridine(55) synthase TruB [Deltaproteobacteria bacterium]|nr:tRNA pseudouridine(55) synthase TruB [Deltaproteobacteria bacterium]